MALSLSLSHCALTLGLSLPLSVDLLFECTVPHYDKHLLSVLYTANNKMPKCQNAKCQIPNERTKHSFTVVHCRSLSFAVTLSVPKGQSACRQRRCTLQTMYGVQKTCRLNIHCYAVLEFKCTESVHCTVARSVGRFGGFFW